MDISADLEELSRTDVAVVSAGVKSILDIPRTLEYLETVGVPVIGYGTDDFPAFYTRRSGEAAPLRLNSPEEVAALLRAKWECGLSGGVLVANPVPEAAALSADYINGVIDAALVEARAQGIRGKETTPFLLAKIVELSDGRSLTANIALAENNAAVAGRIAVAYAR